MIVSREEANGVLRKWATEHSPVSVVLLVGGMAASFSGFITAILSDAMTIEHHGESGTKIAELTVGLEMIDSFEYSDVREATPSVRERLSKRISSSLVMHSNGAQCNLMELVT
jgi:di/tricarboxylate transporter